MKAQFRAKSLDDLETGQMVCWVKDNGDTYSGPVTLWCSALRILLEDAKTGWTSYMTPRFDNGAVFVLIDAPPRKIEVQHRTIKAVLDAMQEWEDSGDVVFGATSKVICAVRDLVQEVQSDES